jgi:hypothetical protein
MMLDSTPVLGSAAQTGWPLSLYNGKLAAGVCLACKLSYRRWPKDIYIFAQGHGIIGSARGPHAHIHRLDGFQLRTRRYNWMFGIGLLGIPGYFVYADYSTNYCNVHNLYCNTQDG